VRKLIGSYLTVPRMGQKGFARESEKEEYDLVAIESVTAAIESAVGISA